MVGRDLAEHPVPTPLLWAGIHAGLQVGSQSIVEGGIGYIKFILDNNKNNTETGKEQRVEGKKKKKKLCLRGFNNKVGLKVF